MTKDTEEFSQFTDAVACREYTLPRDEDTSEPKGWIRGNTKIGPVLEVTTCCLQGKYGVEIRILSVNKDNPHSWVRMSHGLNKLVTDLNNNEQETSEMQFEESALRLSAGASASRSKAKAKPQKRDSASSSTRTIPIGERTWTDVEPGKQSLSEYPVSKKLIHLLRHGSLPRDNHGAIEFWRIQDNLQQHFLYCHHWSDEKWKSSMAGGGREKKRFQYCSGSSGTILYLRALQGHSGRRFLDPSLQDNVIIPDGFFKYIYHVGCAINLHSIIDSGLIPGGQKLINRQTVFFLPVDPMDQEHKDLDTIDLEAPRLAQHMHKTWKKHQNTVYWVDINLALKKGLKFCQTRSNAIIIHETLPAYCIPKVVRMETGEDVNENVYASPRPPPKISLKHDWMKDLGSEVARQPEGEVARQAKSSQSSQPNSNPDRYRTEKTVVCPQEGASQTRFSRDSTNFNVEDETNHDRTVKLVVCRDANHNRSRLTSTSECPDCHILLWNKLRTIVFVSSWRRSRTTLTDNLFNESYNKTMPTTLLVRSPRKWFGTWANVELFELFETEPERKCKECILYWNIGIIYCTCGHLLKESEANRGAIQCTLDLSIPNYVIKKEPPHGHRYGKTTA